MIASRRAVLRRHQAIWRCVCREHGDSFDTQRATIHDVVVIAFHGNEFAVSYRGDHAASTRAEVARGSELTHVRKL